MNRFRHIVYMSVTIFKSLPVRDLLVRLTMSRPTNCTINRSCRPLSPHRTVIEFLNQATDKSTSERVHIVRNYLYTCLAWFVNGPPTLVWTSK